MHVLRRTDICPPGSFPYEQTEGIQHKFEATSDIDAQAHRVADFRKANNLPRATVELAAQDIDEYTCLRLGRMDRYCRDTEGKPYTPPVVRASGSSCGSCGARLA